MSKYACIYTKILAGSKEIVVIYIKTSFITFYWFEQYSRTFANCSRTSLGIRASGSCVVTPAGIKTPLLGLQTE